MRARYFFGLIVGFTTGVALESILGFGYSFAVLCWSVSLFAYLATRVRSRTKNVLFVSLVLFGVGLGIFRVDISSDETSRRSLNNLVGKVTKVEGIIIDEPDVREKYTNVVIETMGVLGSAEAESVGSRLGRHPGREIKSVPILVRVPAYPELKYGDELSLVGKITTPKNFQAEGKAKAFDYQSYLAKDGIYYQMYFPKVSIVAHNKGNLIREKLFAFKAWLINNIEEFIPEPEIGRAHV